MTKTNNNNKNKTVEIHSVQLEHYNISCKISARKSFKNALLSLYPSIMRLSIFHGNRFSLGDFQDTFGETQTYTHSDGWNWSSVSCPRKRLHGGAED